MHFIYSDFTHKCNTNPAEDSSDMNIIYSTTYIWLITIRTPITRVVRVHHAIHCTTKTHRFVMYTVIVLFVTFRVVDL